MDPRTPHDRSQPEGLPQSPAHRTHADGTQASRPADGAARSQAPSQLDTGWRGNAGATDFLGLDLEGAPAQTQRPAQPDAPRQDGTTFAVDSWLMSMESEPAASAGAAPLASSAPRALASPSATAAPDALDSADDRDPPADASSEDQAQSTARPRRSRAAFAFASVAFLALAGAGAWWWNEQRARDAGVEIAQNTPPSQKPRPSDASAAKKPSARTSDAPADVPGDTGAAGAEGSGTGAGRAAAPALVTTGETLVPKPGVAQPDVATTSSDPATGLARSSSAPIDVPRIVVPTDPGALAVVADAAPTTPKSSTSTTWSTVPNAATVPTTSTPAARDGIVRSSTRLPRLPALVTKRAAPASTPAEERNLRSRRATAEELASLWLSPEIPQDALHGEHSVRTLRVGLVNVLLDSGEVVEGNLYSLGGGTVTLDAKVGRVRLAAKDVAQIAQGASPQSAGIAAPGALRVEVLSRHGSFFGRLLARDGDRVVLLTDDGLRLSVEALEVRGTPDRGSRVVGIIDPTL